MGSLRDLLVKGENKVDATRHELRDYDEPLFVDTYAGHGTPQKVKLRGRVVENLPIDASPDQGVAKNMADMLTRYASAEVPFAQVAVRCGGHRAEVEADEEGYYLCEMGWSPEQASAEAGSIWHEVVVELLAPHGEGQQQTCFESWAQIPDGRSRIGIICDIDDTVIETHAHSLLAHARTVLTRNAYTRQVFPGMPELLRALVTEGEQVVNPLFFLSASPWNLHRLFMKIFEFNEVPRGTFFLKDFGLEREHYFKSDHLNYKCEHAKLLIETYPDLDFVLLGDSGQQDMEIYSRLLREHPGRIRACYIRDVSDDLRRAEIAKAIAQLEQEELANVAVLCEESVQMAAHALSIGLITEQELASVEQASRKERSKRATS